MLEEIKKKIKILAIDDEELNLDILLEYFEDEDYDIITAVDGMQGWDLLQNNEIDIVVLDRMMPSMDGLTLLKKIKNDDKFKSTPVIMQTAATSLEQIREGIEAGAFYYLSKPYQKELLLSIVRSAAEDARRYSSLLSEATSNYKAANLLQEALFEFKTLEDVRNLTVLISHCCPKERNVLWGITELMLNAIEHGNLNISYDEKKKLLIEGRWVQEINSRLESEEHKHKICTLQFQKDKSGISITVTDQGNGFSADKYMEIDPSRITDPNGRGIALSKQISFDSIIYLGKGNAVNCKINF